MKKIMSMILVLLLAFGTVVSASAASLGISTDKTVVEKGKKVTVTVALDETIPASANATMFQGELKYNKDLFTCETATASEAYSNMVVKISGNSPVVKFSYFNPSSVGTEFLGGTVLTAEFVAKEDLTEAHLDAEFALSLKVEDKNGDAIEGVEAGSAVSVVVTTGDHTWDEGEVTTEATCSKDGEKTYTCTAEGCGATKTEVIAATGEHVYDEVIIKQEATCVEEGIKVLKCACGAEKEEKIPTNSNHTVVVDEAVDATCTETGLTEGSHCSVCNEVITAQEKVEALGHTMSEEWTTDAKNHWHECTVCGHIEDKAEHSGGTATETEKAVCEGCGAEYGDLVGKEPDEPTTEVPDEPTTEVPNESTTEKSETPAPEKPDTGDDSLVGLYVVIAGIALFGTCIVMKKKEA